MNGLRNTVFGTLGVLLMLMAIAPQASFASGLGWVLNGTVFNAATCQPLAGVNVSSSYNGNAFNISNSNGYYYLVLGTGNWSVSFVKAGFESGYFNTPYETNGAYFHNVSLVPVGGAAHPCGTNTTLINSTTSIPTPGATNSSTSPTTSISGTSGGASSAGGLSTTMIVGIIIVIIVIIAIVAYAMRGKGSKKGATA